MTIAAENLTALDLVIGTVEREAALAAAKAVYDREVESLRAELTVVDARPRRRQRKQTLATALKQARKEGIPVSGATLTTDGSVTLTFGEAKTEPINDLDKWMAKRHAN